MTVILYELTNFMKQSPSTVTQLVKEFTAFYRTWGFITMFTRAHPLSLFWSRWTQAIPSCTWH